MVKTVSMVINQKSPFRKVLEETKGPGGCGPFVDMLTGDRTPEEWFDHGCLLM
jgi:hypothetical protein